MASYEYERGAQQAGETAGGAVEVVTDIIDTDEQLHLLAPEWRRLYLESKPQNPFLSFEWTMACWTHARRRGRPFVLTLRRGGRLVGLAPLYRRRRGPFRVLRFIGEKHSDHLGFLHARDQPGVASLLVKHLRQLGAWDVAFLRPLSDAYSDPYPVPLAGVRAGQVEGPPAPYLSLDRSWDELVAAGPGQLKHTGRWARKFSRDGGTIERLSGANSASAFEEVLQVEAKSWKAEQGFSWGASPARRELLRQALQTVEGLEVWLARLEGRPVAYLVNFVTPERVLFYQGSYDQAYRKYYAGGVLHCAAIRAACEAGLEEYGFLNGGEEYKSGWTTGVHRQRYLALVPDTLRGRAAFAAVVAPRWFLRQFRVAHAVRGLALRRWAAFRSDFAAGGRRA